ncbi:histidine phosphatase family protein [Limnobacter humi]|uniref:Histidine phosphatase family protein n=1 Tax=Limnobacter humi TaxID=1778671 RepID=A0ABT1WH92_9BURK|nr:histidine phosphatase family protein [Limnobacter humi]MCQ8896855.1 histidine phosphatase family protein [Limnobacter humi]
MKDLLAAWPKAMDATRFILVRHGETDWNQEKRFQGHTDIPLNTRGLHQARQVANCLRELETALGCPHGLYQQGVSSDLNRALTTAKLIHGSRPTPLHITTALRERDYGHLSGLTGDEMHAKSPAEFAALKVRDPETVIQGGESLIQFSQRVVTCVQGLHQAHAGQTLLLVAHGGVLDSIYRHCTDEPLHKPRAWLLPNCGIHVVDIHANGRRNIVHWAYTDHLTGTDGNPAADEVDGRVA